MKNIICLSILSVTILLGSLNQAFAGEDRAGNIGASYGLSVPDYAGSTSRTIVGFQGTAKLGSEWGLGGYYLSSSKTESGTALTGDFTYQLYGVKGTYHFEGEARGVYFGGMLGVSKIHAGTADTSPTHYGALAGYDKMFGDMFSVGGEFSYVMVGASSTTLSGVNVNLNSFNALNFSVGIKLWFQDRDNKLLS